MKVNWKTFSITIIISVLMILRFIKLGQNPISLYWDELAIGFDAYSISETGRDIHGNSWFQAIYPSYGDYKAPLAICLVGLSFKVFGQSEWALRLPFALFGVLGSIAFYFLIKELITHYLDRKKYSFIPIISLIVILATPWHYHFSRIGFESGLSINLLIIALLFAIYGLFKNKFWLIISSLTSVLCVYSYISARYIAPIFIGSIILFNFKKAWKSKFVIAIAISLFIILQIPISKSPFYFQSQQYRWSAQNILTDGKAYEQSAQLILDHGNTTFSKIIYHRYLLLAKSFLHNYLSHFTVSFLFLSGDPNLRHHSGWGGQLLPITIILFIFGLYWLIKNFKNRLSQITLILLLVSPLTASIPNEIPHSSRSIYLLIPLMIIIMLGVIQIFYLLEQFQSKHIIIKKMLLPLIIILILFNFSLYLEDYFNHYPARSAYAWQLGNKYIGQIVKQEKNNYKKIIIPSSFGMPVNSILFYNPDIVLKIQQANIKKNIGNSFWWVGQDFYQFQFNRQNIDIKEFRTLKLSTNKQGYENFINKTYVYPNGDELLYKLQLN